jgi:hypothetical protein
MAFHGVLLTSSVNLNVGSMYWFSRCQVSIPSIIHLLRPRRQQQQQLSPRVLSFPRRQGRQQTAAPATAPGARGPALWRQHEPAAVGSGTNCSCEEACRGGGSKSNMRLCAYFFFSLFFFRGWWRGGAEAAAQVNVSDYLERRRVGMEPNNNKNNIWAAASTW